MKRILQPSRAKPRSGYRPIEWLLRSEGWHVGSVVDEYTRECLALEVDRGIASEDVIDTLSALVAMRGVRRQIRSDNGPEGSDQALRRWLRLVGVDAGHRAGKPLGERLCRDLPRAASP